jgi:hypothetical protein
MDQCNEILYPNIKKILHIIACFPISVASAERSFSTLRRLVSYMLLHHACLYLLYLLCTFKFRLKTWLRSIMGEERLVGLALLNIY